MENSYSFTDLSQLNIAWELGGTTDNVPISLAPGAKGEIQIPIPPASREGERLRLARHRRHGQPDQRARDPTRSAEGRLSKPRAGVPKMAG